MRDVVGRLLVQTARIAGDGYAGTAPIDVLGLLHAHAARWPSPPEVDVVHALCRRLGVAKQVWTAYDAGWKPLPDATPLDPGGLALLAAVCLASAAAEGERGLRLKALNGALVALDRLPSDASITMALGEAAGVLAEALA
jgi:hypothetical protein